MAVEAQKIMVRSVQTIEPEASLTDALNRMNQKNIRHLVVTDTTSGTILGIVSDRDIKKFCSPFAGTDRETAQDRATLMIPVKNLMKRNVWTAKPHDDIKQIIETMLQKKINAVPIVDDDGRPCGIVSTSDLLRHLLIYL